MNGSTVTTISEISQNADPQQVEMEKAIAKMIDQKVEQFGDARKATNLMVKANTSYLAGHQNIAVENNTIVPVPEEYQTSVTMNRILPAVTNDIAVGTKSEPVFDIVPNTTDENDKKTAKLCKPLVKHLQQVNGKDLKRKAAILWFDLAGISWRKCWVDPKYVLNLGAEDPDNRFGPEVLIDIVPNHELIMDTRVKDVTKHKWMIHITPKTISEIAGEFGEEVAALIPQTDYRDIDSNLSEYETQIMGDFIETSKALLPDTKSATKETGFPADKQVERLEFWHQPCAEIPEGIYAIKLGTILIYGGAYPIKAYPHGRIPFTGCSPLALDGITQNSVSRISQARPVQRYYNQFLSQIADNLNAVGNSVIFSHASNNLVYSKMDNHTANLITYDGIAKPHREPGVQVPSAIFAFVDKLEKMMDEIFAFHEPSRGVMPTGGPDSAKGLQLLQDADFTQIAPVIKALDESDERLVYQALTLMMANYGERTIAIAGDDNQWLHYDINAEEMIGKISVSVRTGSSMPINRAIEADKTYNIWNSGLLGDRNNPQIRQFVLNRMDLGNIELITQQNAKQVNFARKEFAISMQKAKEMPPIPEGANAEEVQAWLAPFVFVPTVTPLDDHPIHIQEHQDDILNVYYEFSNPTASPALQLTLQGMMDHWNLHIQMQQQIQMSQMQQQMQAEAYTKGNTESQILLKQAAKLADVRVKKELGNNKASDK